MVEGVLRPEASGDVDGSGDHALFERWQRVVRGSGARVALADGEDPRAVGAALELHGKGLLAPRLVGLSRFGYDKGDEDD